MAMVLMLHKNGIPRARLWLGLIALLCIASPLWAQASNPVQYFYDDAGRLTKVVDPSGDVATYNYDALGNLLSISRTTAPANGGLAIFNFSPQSGPVGATVIIQGQGFSTTPSADAVQFNGTAATVSAASASSLTVTVPASATTGPISVTVSGNTASSSASFTVAARTLLSIAVSPANSTVPLGGGQQFDAVGRFSDGTSQDVTTSVTWSSSNSSIAAISNSPGIQGLATSASAGFVGIVATSGSIIGSAGLTVKTIQNITISPQTPTVLKGGAQQFTASASYTDGTSVDVSSSVTWASSNSAVATISNSLGTQGLASGVANGTATITATLGQTNSSTSLNVNSLVSVTVSPANSSLPKGSYQQFTAVANYSDSTTQDVTRLAAWTSSNTAVARISNSPGTQGIATPVTPGTSTISATYQGVVGSTGLTVTGPTPASITVTPNSPLVPPGGTLQLKAMATLTDGTTQDITSTATWSSSATSVATVSSQGLITGVANGTATITATSGTVSGSASLTVTSSQIYQGTVYAADGATPVAVPGFPHSDVQQIVVYDVASGAALASASLDANGFYQATGAAPGAQGVSVQAQLQCSGRVISATGSANGGQPITVNMTLPLAIVTGNVSFYDGTPVSDADVFLTADQSCYGLTEESEIGITDANGNYAIFPELTVGAFTVYAQDSGGLFNGVSANLAALSTPITVDVSLPPTGTVSGSAFDASSNPLTQGQVQLFSSIGEFVKTDPLQGANSFSFDQVPVGIFVVTAGPPITDNDCTGCFLYPTEGASVGTLGAAGSQTTANVTLEPTSSVSGTVFASDGVTPLSSAIVTIENPGVANGIADSLWSAVTDSSGNFSLPNIPIGPIRIFAGGSEGTASTGGVVSGILTQGNGLALNPILGNAEVISLGGDPTYVLTDGNGFVFDLDSFGEPVSGGFQTPTEGPAYADGAFPDFNGGEDVPYASGNAALDQNGRQLTFGPTPMAGDSASGFGGAVLQFERKVFVPQNGGFARYLEVITNPTNVSQTVSFEVDSGVTSFFDTLAVDPTSNGQTYAVVTSQRSTDETLAYVMGGNSAVPTSSGLNLLDSAFSYAWTVTVAPGQTVILMHFLIQRAPGDVSDATSQAQSLVNLTDPNALVGMTAQEKSEVLNFNVQ